MLGVKSTPPLSLTPPAGWRQLTSNFGSEVWVTSASSSDIERFEPGVKLSECETPNLSEQTLRVTDHGAFVVLDRQKGVVTVECRPRAADRLYVSRQEATVEIAAGIEHASPRIRSASLSTRFVAIWLANALRFGSFDHFLGCSPFDGFYLIARGFRAELDLATQDVAISFVSEQPEDCSSATGDLKQAVARCRSALVGVVANATRHSDVAAECSGGIDSGLTAIFANRTAGDRFRGGIFADFPYHEFRKERDYAQCIASSEGFSLLASDPSLSMYWGALRLKRMSNISSEPSLDAPFWGQALAAYDLMRDYRSPAILTGQGGDLLFQTRDISFSMCASPNWISKTQWQVLSEEMERICKWIEAPSRVCSGYGYDNPWMSRALGRIHNGAIYYSPLSSRSVIESVLNLRRVLGPELEERAASLPIVQKPLAHVAFGEFLPSIVWTRRWKVNYVAHHYRFWLNYGQNMVQLVKRMRPYLEALSFRPKAVLECVTELAEGRNSSDRLLNALVTYLFWLDQFIANK